MSSEICYWPLFLSSTDKTIKLWKISERDKRPEGYNLKEEDGRYKDPNAISGLRVSQTHRRSTASKLQLSIISTRSFDARCMERARLLHQHTLWPRQASRANRFSSWSHCGWWHRLFVESAGSLGETAGSLLRSPNFGLGAARFPAPTGTGVTKQTGQAKCGPSFVSGPHSWEQLKGSQWPRRWKPRGL